MRMGSERRHRLSRLWVSEANDNLPSLPQRFTTRGPFLRLVYELRSLADTLSIHLGRSWSDGLAQQRPVRSHEPLYHVVTYVDVTRGTQLLFRLARPVRVLPLVFSWIDQLARASQQVGRAREVGDGDALFDLTVHRDDVLLRDEGQYARMPRQELNRALERLLHLLERDMMRVARGDILLPIQEQIQRAHAVLERLREERPPRKHRRLHTASSLQAPQDRAILPDRPTQEFPREAPPRKSAPALRKRLRSIQLLRYEHRHLLRIASEHLQDVFFSADDQLILCADDRVQRANITSGSLQDVPISAPSKAQNSGLRNLAQSILYDADDHVVVLHPLADAWSRSTLRGVRHSHQIKTLITRPQEALAYLRGTTVIDAPTGVALLHHVAALVPRQDHDQQVVGWYALDHTLRTVWWDGDGEVAPLYTFEGACVKISAHPHGLIAHIVTEARRYLCWIRTDGSLAWQRELPADVPEFRRGGSLRVHVDKDRPNHLCIQVVASYKWWAFCVHVRTQLTTFVQHHQESDAVRLYWTAQHLICTSGEHLRVYPLTGRMPPALWQDRVPKALGVLAPVFPLSVRGELLAHANEDVIVRRVQDGKLLATYRHDWTAIFDLRFTQSLDLIVAAAEPGRRIDLYHAEPTHWLGLLDPP